MLKHKLSTKSQTQQPPTMCLAR